MPHEERIQSAPRVSADIALHDGGDRHEIIEACQVEGHEGVGAAQQPTGSVGRDAPLSPQPQQLCPRRDEAMDVHHHRLSHHRRPSPHFVGPRIEGAHHAGGRRQWRPVGAPGQRHQPRHSRSLRFGRVKRTEASHRQQGTLARIAAPWPGALGATTASQLLTAAGAGSREVLGVLDDIPVLVVELGAEDTVEVQVPVWLPAVVVGVAVDAAVAPAPDGVDVALCRAGGAVPPGWVASDDPAAELVRLVEHVRRSAHSSVVLAQLLRLSLVLDIGAAIMAGYRLRRSRVGRRSPPGCEDALVTRGRSVPSQTRS